MSVLSGDTIKRLARIKDDLDNLVLPEGAAASLVEVVRGLLLDVEADLQLHLISPYVTKDVATLLIAGSWISAVKELRITFAQLGLADLVKMWAMAHGTFKVPGAMASWTWDGNSDTLPK